MLVRIQPEEPVSCPQGVIEYAYAASNGRGSRCESWCGHLLKEHVRHRRGNGPENRCAPLKRPECDCLFRGHTKCAERPNDALSRQAFSGAPPIFSSLSSSTAEPPADNRQTVEHHHAEGPFLKTRWMAQTDERRIEDPQRWARYPLQRPFHCGIDVTASISVFQTERVGAAPTCRTTFKFLRGRHRKAPIS